MSVKARRGKQAHVAEGVPLLLPEGLKVVGSHWFADEKNLKYVGGKGIWGIILKVTSPKPPMPNQYGNNKKPRNNYQPSRQYHRWILCGDLMNPPNTFAIITHSYQESFKFLRYAADMCLLGMPFYLTEPTISASRLGKYLPLVEVKKEIFIPLKSIATRHSVNIKIPSDGEQTYFFVLEKQSIGIATTDCYYNTCRGVMCDRQEPGESCACVRSGHGCPLVYEYGIIYEAYRKQFGRKQEVVTKIASYQTMSVFFRNLNQYTNDTCEANEGTKLLKERRRKQTRLITNFINRNGGWKLVGWDKRGLLQVDGESEKVANDEVTLHLSYVYPQDESIFQNAAFQKLRITDDFLIPDEELENVPLDDIGVGPEPVFEFSESEPESSPDSEGLEHEAQAEPEAEDFEIASDRPVDAVAVAVGSGDDDSTELTMATPMASSPCRRKGTSPKSKNVTPDKTTDMSKVNSEASDNEIAQGEGSGDDSSDDEEDGDGSNDDETSTESEEESKVNKVAFKGFGAAGLLIDELSAFRKKKKKQKK